MAKLIVEEQKDIPTLPAESIINVLVDHVDVRTVNGPRGDWDKLEFKFKITGIQHVPNDHPSNYDSLVGEFIYGSTPMRLTDSQENKLRLWSEAILNRPLELGFELDTDYFLKRECRAVTSTYEKRAKNPVTQKPFVGHQVQSLLPIGNGPSGSGAVPGGASQQAPQQPPQQWGGQQVQTPAQPPQQQVQPVGAGQAQDPWGTPGVDTGDEPPF